jgi:hypothetical protein
MKDDAQRNITDLASVTKLEISNDHAKNAIVPPVSKFSDRLPKFVRPGVGATTT